jgi:hypothetical protein
MAINVSEFPRVLGNLDRLKFKSQTQSRFKELTATNPQAIVKYCKSQGRRGTKDQEAVILNSQNPKLVMDYMINNSIKAWPEAEAVLATDPKTALWYSKQIGQRFPAGEASIATNVESSFQYALDVIGGRWPEAEQLIRTKPGIWEAYVDEVMGGVDDNAGV